MDLAFVAIALVVAVVFGGLGSWIAGQKNRPKSEGLILGFAFGPLGALIEALLPSLSGPAPQFCRVRCAAHPGTALEGKMVRTADPTKRPR
jgi:hypothetical protein